MTVTGERSEASLSIVTVADTTRMFALTEASRSAYVWDAEGLKHLYRISAGGDCTAFDPPRLVFPARLETGRIARSSYRFRVYSAGGEERFQASVEQQQKLLASVEIAVPGGRFEAAPGVETIWTDTYSDGSSQTRRRAVWYAREVGPVRIVSGIPANSPRLEGDATGLLDRR